MIRSALAVVLAAAFLLPAHILPLAAQEKVAADQAEPKQARQPVKGRLPAYYGQIVDAGQRQRIYQIQATYNPRIEALRAEVEALIAKRDEEIRAVLSPEQAQRLEARIAEAKATRAANAAKKAEQKIQNVPAIKEAAAKKAG